MSKFGDGSLLFLIYVNNLPNVSNFHTALFADDTNLHLSHLIRSIFLWGPTDCL